MCVHRECSSKGTPMHPIELPPSVGAPLAKWQRVCCPLTLPELLGKIRCRMARKISLWHQGTLKLAFKARNLATGNAAIRRRVGGVGLQLVPVGKIAFHAWSGLPFERAELEFVLRMLDPGTTFLDIGADIGLFSLAAGQKLRGRSFSIYACEACPSTFAILQKNLAQNELTEVRAIRAAFSSKTGEANLYVNAALKDALNSFEDPSHISPEVAIPAPIQTITLDDFVARQRLAHVDFMKVDVGGAEMLVFRGAKKLLQRTDAPLILYKGHSWLTAGFHYHPVELMWQLEEFGYELFVLDAASGRLRRRTPGEGYDAMGVAVKRSHLRYDEMVPAAENA
jgi:FkbM family methyltransferase